MTRNEVSGPIDREELKREIRYELKTDERKKRFRWMMLMLVIMLALIAAPFIVTGVLLAKSGFVDVPVLSAWLYDPVAPIRSVAPLSGSTSEAVLNAAVVRAEYNPNFGTIRLYLTEKELTTVINSAISNEEADTLPFPVESAQAVLSNGLIEIYAITEREDGLRVPLLVQLKPDIENGRMTTDSEKLIIGSLDIPDFAADAIVRSITAGLSNAVNDALANGGELENIEVTEGRIEVMLMTSR